MAEPPVPGPAAPVPVPPPPVEERRLAMACAAIVTVFVLAVFGGVLANGFVNIDDDVNIFANPHFHPPSWAGLSRLWHAPYFGLYIPVTYTVWGALVALSLRGGRVPALPFHALNLALHVANACLVLFLLRRILGGDFTRRLPAGHAPTARRLWVAALLGALAFASHPVQVEPVAWVTGFKDVGAAFWSLLALSLLPSSQDARKKALRYGAATVAFAVALLSKPTSMVIIPVAALLELSREGRMTWGTARRLGPWLLVAAGIAMATMHMETPNAEVVVPLGQRPLVALDTLAFYLGKLAWPAHLSVQYGRTPQVALREPLHLHALLGGVALVLALLALRRRPPLLLAAAIFVACLAPVLGLVPFLFQVFSTVTDRYLYLSLFGVGLAMAWLGLRGPRPLVICGFLLIAAWGVRSAWQVPHWKNGRTLNANLLAIDPQNGIASAMFGEFMLMEERDPHRAIVALERARDVAAGFSVAWLHFDLGLARVLGGDLQAAERELGKGLKADPSNVSLAVGPSYNNLGWVHERLGERAAAAREYAAALAAEPNQAEAHYNLARLAACAGQAPDAAMRAHLERATQLRPEFTRARALLRDWSAAAGSSSPCPSPALAWPLGPPAISWEAWEAIERDGL
ncbi:MAG TPA: tetratricopeptide repeat protein [Polyangia bacterium]